MIDFLAWFFVCFTLINMLLACKFCFDVVGFADLRSVGYRSETGEVLDG